MSELPAKPRRAVAFIGYAIIVMVPPIFVAALEIASWFVLGSRGITRYPLFYAPPEGRTEKVLADEPWFQLIDPQLSHAYSPEFLAGRLKEFTVMPGFVAYADPAKRPNALRTWGRLSGSKCGRRGERSGNGTFA